MKNLPLILMMCALCGCTQLQMLPYLDQALLLQAYGDDKEAQHKAVIDNDTHYAELQAAIADGTIKNYPTRASIEKKFGAPILIAPSRNTNGPIAEQALYRKAIGFKAKDKVYLDYAKDGSVVKWETIKQ